MKLNDLNLIFGVTQGMSQLETNQGLLEAAIEINARRANNLRRMKELILKGEKDQAWELLLKHLGLDEAKTSQLKLVENKCAAKRRRRG